jgi:predicted GTPase
VIAVLRRALAGRSAEFYLFLTLLWLLPGLLLLALGGVYLWQAGWFWWFSLALVSLSLLTMAIRHISAEEAAGGDDAAAHLAPTPDWSERDRRIWRHALEHIGEAKLPLTPWEAVPAAMLDQLGYVGRQYRPDDPDAAWAFSAPELLLMLETWSREYRALVIEHAPLARDVRISSLRSFSRRTGTVRKLYQLVSPAVSVAKILWNPAGGITSEIRSRLLAGQIDGFSEHMQWNMKQALFEQVTQVAIDLYSGRLRLSAEELSAHRRAQTPPQEEVLQPLTVMVLGQVSAGKSSLINALVKRCVAEVDALPATAGFRYYHLLLPGGLAVNLLDSPGLDGSERTTGAVLEKALEADLLLWLSQANRPAKALDRAMLDNFNAYYRQHPRRLAPPILLVTTHNDALPPAGEWHPPRDLGEGGDSRAANILEALRYTHRSLGLGEETPMVPVSLAPGAEPWNLEVLVDLLVAASDAARASQLNRERQSANSSWSAVRQAMRTSVGLLRVGVDLALK